MDKKEIIKIIVVITILLVIGIYSIVVYKTEKEEIIYYEENLNEILEVNKIVESEETKISKIKVYITGEVNNPGVKELEEGSRIEDLINLAGGLTINADISGVNLAYCIEDGMKVYIPNINDKNENEIISLDNQEGIIKNIENKKQNKININEANLEELCELPGVGEALAQRIIDYREENGKFRNQEDLKNVSGFGEKKYEKLKEYIFVK